MCLSRGSSRPPSAMLVALATLMTVGACTDPTTPDPSAARAAFPVGTHASAAHVAVCHLDDSGVHRLVSVNQRAIPAHRSHGDALPGEAIPGRAGYRFGERCEPVATFTNIDGIWEGTYDWSCDASRTGSTPIRFVLRDPGTGFISGTASYLGGSSDLNLPFTPSYRMSHPVYRDNGTLLFGVLDPNGLIVRLYVQPAAGHFVYNEFDGTISPDFTTISGGTLNGDSPTPGGPGCSAADGYSGKFTIRHVP